VFSPRHHSLVWFGWYERNIKKESLFRVNVENKRLQVKTTCIDKYFFQKVFGLGILIASKIINPKT